MNDLDEFRHSNFSRVPVRGCVWLKVYFSVVKIPPVDWSFSNWNRGLSGSLSIQDEVEDIEDLAELKSIDEKLAEMGFGAGGQSVISVVVVTLWNFAKQIIVPALLGPEWRIISGLGVTVLDRGSF